MDCALDIAQNGRMTRALCALVLSCALAGTARADTRRLALVVGDNAGNVGLKPLRYAESDAAKFARVLTELGGVQHDDLLLLEGPGATEVDRAFELLTAHVAELHREPDTRVVLIFYFSGHSDGTALELGHDRLEFAHLKQLLASTGAEVKLAIVDACQSGGLLDTKGGRAGSAFAVTLSDDTDARGSVFLTSAASSEYALESSEVQGSYFTHHLVSGLRGAADQSGDGRVTLAEAYRYAFDHTVAATSATTVGAQHPRYEYELSGQGELVLTELRDRPTAALQLPADLSRALIYDLGHDQVVAEVGPGAPTRVTVTPGTYGVRIWRGKELLGERVDVRAGEERRVQWAELTPDALSAVASKGAGPSDAEVEQPAVSEVRASDALFGITASAGVSRGFEDTGGLLGLRIGAENMHASGFGFVVSAAFGSSSATASKELDAMARLQLRLGADLGRARIFFALEGGPGFASGKRQGASFSGPLVGVGPRVGARFELTRRVYLTAEGEALGGASYYLGHVQTALLPSAQLGVEIGAF